MAPTKTAAKGRARASRTSDAGAAAAVESPPAAAADDTPRRRGRPAKGEAGVSKDKVKKAYVPTGRPRGRPANPNTVPKAPYVPTGRPRGRPPGTGKKAAKAAAMKARGAHAAAAKKGKGTTVARGGPKGRKSDAAKAKEDEELGEDVDMGDSGEEQADDDEQLSDEDGGE